MKIQYRRGVAVGALLAATCALASGADAAGVKGVVTEGVLQITGVGESLPVMPGHNAVVSGDTAVLAVNRGEPVGAVMVMHGQINVYQRVLGVWSQQSVITPSNPADSLYFGRSIALQGDTLVVGVGNPPPAVSFTEPPTNPTTLRAAYVYQRQGGVWTETARLAGSDALATTYDFGADVAVSGSTITVSATGGLRQYCTTTCATLEQRTGATYVFDRNAAGAWTQTARIPTASLIGSAGFSGNTLAVPQIERLANGRIIGRLAVWQRTAGTWARQALLTAADQTPASSLLSTTPPAVMRGLFASGAVPTPAIDADTILAPGAEMTAKDARGSVYVFKRTGASWTQEAKILPKASKPYDGFGTSLSLSGNRALVGGYLPQVSLLTRSGTTWTETVIGTPGIEARRSVDYFGRGLSLDNTTALITQPWYRGFVYAITQ